MRAVETEIYSTLYSTDNPISPMLGLGIRYDVGLVIVHSPRAVSEITEVLYRCKLSYHHTYSRYPLSVIMNNYCLSRHA